MEATKKIKIMMAEDHDLVRESILSGLKLFENINVIGEAANGLEMLALINKNEPDVLITDIDMPVMGGFELVPIIKSKYPHIKIIVVTMHSGSEFIKEMILRGTNSFLPKNCGMQELHKAIEKVYYEEFYFQESIPKTLVATLQNRKQQSYFADKSAITPRETEILKLLCEGKSTKEIADILNISEDTVESHRRNIYKKTNCESFAALMKFAIRNGITGLD